jgi:hypothetical protein
MSTIPKIQGFPGISLALPIPLHNVELHEVIEANVKVMKTAAHAARSSFSAFLRVLPYTKTLASTLRHAVKFASEFREVPSDLIKSLDSLRFLSVFCIPKGIKSLGREFSLLGEKIRHHHSSKEILGQAGTCAIRLTSLTNVVADIFKAHEKLGLKLFGFIKPVTSWTPFVIILSTALATIGTTKKIFNMKKLSPSLRALSDFRCKYKAAKNKEDEKVHAEALKVLKNLHATTENRQKEGVVKGLQELSSYPVTNLVKRRNLFRRREIKAFLEKKASQYKDKDPSLSKSLSKIASQTKKGKLEEIRRDFEGAIKVSSDKKTLTKEFMAILLDPGTSKQHILAALRNYDIKSENPEEGPRNDMSNLDKHEKLINKFGKRIDNPWKSVVKIQLDKSILKNVIENKNKSSNKTRIALAAYIAKKSHVAKNILRLTTLITAIYVSVCALETIMAAGVIAATVANPIIAGAAAVAGVVTLAKLYYDHKNKKEEDYDAIQNASVLSDVSDIDISGDD